MKAHLRNAIDKQLSALPNVWASAQGIKITDGTITRTPCITAIVRRKLPTSRLRGKAVPKRINIGRKWFATDVIEIGELTQHCATSSIQDATAIRNEQDHDGGILTSYATDGNTLYGISCAHVLWGSDNIVTSADAISRWDAVNRTWVLFGTTHTVTYDQGKGSHPNFGLLDVGLIRIDDAQIKDSLANLSSRPVFKPTESEVPSLHGRTVRGQTAARPCHGTITNTHLREILGEKILADVLITCANSERTMFKGDSGTLWSDDQNRAIAVHTLGENNGPGTGSTISVATFAFRIADALHVSLLT